MKAKLISISLAALSITSINLAYADLPQYQRHHNQDQNNQNEGFQVSVNGPDGNFVFGNKGIFDRGHHRRHHHRRDRDGDAADEMQWVYVRAGFPIPPNAFVGGTENYQPLYLCRANYGNGVHPGKVVNGNCNISWGGREIPINRYQVLISQYPLNWEPASNGDVPDNAIPGGFEDGHNLYVCQTRYHGGVHPGKIVGNNCDIAWGGREVSVPVYRVLVG